MVFAGKGFGSSKDGAVGDNQWDKDAQYLVQLVGVGFHQQFGAGYKGGDNYDEGGQSYGIADLVANQRDDAVGTSSTIRVAIPNPSALTTVPVTASSGHRPSSWTSAGLCSRGRFC